MGLRTKLINAYWLKEGLGITLIDLRVLYEKQPFYFSSILQCRQLGTPVHHLSQHSLSPVSTNGYSSDESAADEIFRVVLDSIQHRASYSEVLQAIHSIVGIGIVFLMPNVLGTYQRRLRLTAQERCGACSTYLKRSGSLTRSTDHTLPLAYHGYI